MTDDTYVFAFLPILLAWFAYASTRKPLEYRQACDGHRQRVDRCNLSIENDNALASVMMTWCSLLGIGCYIYGKATGAIT